jgi:hypothetical protein
MLFSNKNLLATFEAAFRPLGFSFDETHRVFRRQRGEVTDILSVPIDLRDDAAGEMAVLVISVNLSVVRTDTKEAITRNIGYLMPGHEWHEWEIDAGSATDRLAVDVASAIRRFGLPWLASYQTPEQITIDARRSVRHSMANLARRALPAPRYNTAAVS